MSQRSQPDAHQFRRHALGRVLRAGIETVLYGLVEQGELARDGDVISSQALTDGAPLFLSTEAAPRG